MAERDEHRLTTNVWIDIVLRWAPPRCPSEHVENSFDKQAWSNCVGAKGGGRTPAKNTH